LRLLICCRNLTFRPNADKMVAKLKSGVFV
jgi:hypothetical protein